MNDLEVMNQMVKNNSKGIKVSTNVTDLKMVKAGGKITFGVGSDTYSQLSKQFGLGKHTCYVAMYVIDKEEFDAIQEKSMETTVS